MSESPTIIITGSSGLVGSGLVSYFSGRGFKVRAFQRKPGTDSGPNISYYPFDLSDFGDNGFEGADYIVHCAYRPFISRQERKSGINTDIEATKKIIRFSRKHRVKIVFMSTMSAHSESRSYYARHKLMAEGLFDTGQDLILKLGLVLGSGGGLFGRILSNLKKHKFVPLIGGRQATQTIVLDDLCRIVEAGIREGITGKFYIANPRAVTTEELYKCMAESISVNPLFIPVPWTLTYRLVQLFELAGLKLPFTSQNVLGLLDMRTYDTNPDLGVFGVKTKDYRTMLSQSNSSHDTV